MGQPAERLAVLADLRARIAAPRVLPGRVAAELPGIDAWIGGWPRPGVAEVVGAPGSGRLGLVIPAVAALTRRGRPVVVVDAMEQVFPPGWAHPVAGEGAELSALWVVRPGLDRAAWAAEQVARSGAVELVVLLDAPRLGRHAVRLGRACEAGGSTLLVVAEQEEVDLPAAVRLVVKGQGPTGLLVACTRSRDGRQVGERVVAAG